VYARGMKGITNYQLPRYNKEELRRIKKNWQTTSYQGNMSAYGRYRAIQKMEINLYINGVGPGLEAIPMVVLCIP